LVLLAILGKAEQQQMARVVLLLTLQIAYLHEGLIQSTDHQVQAVLLQQWLVMVLRD
jgi:hypothetical protein